jgi:hypothetical protein
MEKQLWAKVSIAVHPNKKELDEYGNWRINHYHWHVIKEWHYPKWIVDRHRRFFKWVLALVQSRFPKHSVEYRYAGYYPETKERLCSKRQQSISAAKAQITKVENIIRDYEAEKNKSLWSDLNSDPIHKKLIEKLEQKKFNLQQAIMMEIEETI